MSDAKKTTLPKAPQHEGVDPLTDGHRYHGEDVKGGSNFHEVPEDTAADDSATLMAEQQEVDAKANTPDANLPDEDKTAPANQPDQEGEETPPAETPPAETPPAETPPAETPKKAAGKASK